MMGLTYQEYAFLKEAFLRKVGKSCQIYKISIYQNIFYVYYIVNINNTYKIKL